MEKIIIAHQFLSNGNYTRLGQ